MTRRYITGNSATLFTRSYEADTVSIAGADRHPHPQEKARHDQEGSHLAWYRVLDLFHRLQPELGSGRVLVPRGHDRRYCPGLRPVLHEPRRLASLHGWSC